VSSEFIFMLAKTRKHRFFADELVERGNVWKFPPSKGRNHLAPFPSELPERCIPLTTEVGQVVLDPFSGSGTTIAAAESLGRVGLGCDIYHW
jgi:DNA modification methylase